MLWVSTRRTPNEVRSQHRVVDMPQMRWHRPTRNRMREHVRHVFAGWLFIFGWLAAVVVFGLLLLWPFFVWGFDNPWGAIWTGGVLVVGISWGFYSDGVRRQ